MTRFINVYAAVADDNFARLGEAGRVAVVDAEEQRWLDRRLGELRPPIDAFFGKLRDTHGPVECYNRGAVAEAADGSAMAAIIRLRGERPDAAAWLQVDFIRTEAVVAVAVVDPDLLSAWCEAAGAPAAAVAAVRSTAAAHSATLADAVRASANRAGEAALDLAVLRQIAALRQSVWDVIATRLTPAQRRSFAARIQVDGATDNAGDADARDRQRIATVRFVNRLSRRWSTDRPAAAVADSDRVDNGVATADGLYSLYRADRADPVATVRVRRGQDVGFAFDGPGETGISASAGDRVVPVAASESLYYWAPAAAGTPTTVPAGTVTLQQPSTAP